MAIGRRPAHPARSRAVKNREISQRNLGRLGGNADRRSVTPGTTKIKQLQ